MPYGFLEETPFDDRGRGRLRFDSARDILIFSDRASMSSNQDGKKLELVRNLSAEHDGVIFKGKSGNFWRT